MDNYGTLKSQKRTIAVRRRANKNFQRDLKAWTEEHDFVLPMLETMLADVKDILPEYSNADYLKDLSTIRNRMRTEGLGFATKALPLLLESVFQELETGDMAYLGFRKCRRPRPAFLGGVTDAIFEQRTQRTTRIQALDCVYQVCVAFSKLKGPYAPAGLMKQIREFVQTDQSLPEKLEDFAPECKSVLEVARDIISDVFADFTPEMGKPRPGPGATNTPVPKSLRFIPHKLYRQIDDTLPYMDLFYPHWYYAFINSSVLRALYNDAAVAPTSRFKFVPKKVGKARGICIEENEMQFAQQGIRDYMVTTIESHPETRGRVNFTDQEINQILALLASSDLSLATLDAKEASDRTPRILVHYLFSGVPALRDIIIALSTRLISLPEDVSDVKTLSAKKYAPMGSALCFPVMGMVFYALLRAIILTQARSENDSYRVFVYGDDMIVPSIHTELVYTWLPKFGFKLNQTKSFYRSHFRESCGVHAFHGQIITPVYVKRVPNTRLKRQGLVVLKDSTNALLSMISTERDLFKKGYLRTCQQLRDAVRGCLGYVLPQVSYGSSVLGWKRLRPDNSAVNAVQRVRYCGELQKWLFRVRMVCPKTTSERMDQESCYLRKLLTMSNTRPRPVARPRGWSVLRHSHAIRPSQPLRYYLSLDGAGQKVVKGRVQPADSVIGSCEYLAIRHMYVDEPTLMQMH